MHGPPMQSPGDMPQMAAALIERLRARSPRVHCITNAVAQNFTANVLLAAGCVPSMTLVAEEIGAFVAGADALWSISAPSTASAARRPRSRWRRPTAPSCPGCSIRSSSTARAPRADFARELVAMHADGGAAQPGRIFRAVGRGRGTRPRSPTMRAATKPSSLCRARPISITDGERLATVANGHALMAQGDRHGLRRLGAGGGLSGGRRRTPGARRRRRWS